MESKKGWLGGVCSVLRGGPTEARQQETQKKDVKSVSKNRSIFPFALSCKMDFFSAPFGEWSFLPHYYVVWCILEGINWGDVQPLKVKVLFGIFVSELVRHIDCPFCKPLGSMELGQIWDRFLDRIHTAFNVLPTHQLLSGVISVICWHQSHTSCVIAFFLLVKNLSLTPDFQFHLECLASLNWNWQPIPLLY